MIVGRFGVIVSKVMVTIAVNRVFTWFFGSWWTKLLL